ncbi:hypothetical protein GTQ99_22615, partial [Kineococcus sp. T13]|uniref:family 78 glycoside hydrolase catalytic domain n=1 Tax=Kineococcus vitellinus TaxID=2696565 RepID=UPI00141305EC
RGISHLVGERVSPARVSAVSSHPAPAWSSDHPVPRVLQAVGQDGAARPAAGTATSTDAAELPVRFPLERGRVQHLAVDFGRIVVGFVEVDVDAPAGTAVELHYREKALRADPAAAQLDPATGARYVCAGGKGTFEALEVNGLRHLHLVVHAGDADQQGDDEVQVAEAEVTISRVQVREHLYPRTGGAYFTSSDPVLEILYRAGVRTVQANSLDAYTDCPTREQRAWVGDGVVHQQVDLVTNADWGLAANFVELGDSPRPDGILPMVVAGEVEAGGGLTIPDWSLSWTHGVHVLHRHDGDLERARTHLPTVERILRWYTTYLDQRGTIAEVPEWNLVDWSSIHLSGRSAALTGLWARSLAEFAELSEAAGNPGSAAWARALHAAAADGLEDFWDEQRGVYVDHVVDGQRRPAVSQATNAAVIVSGLAPRERWARIVERITDPERVVVRSWIGDYDTAGYSFAKMAEQSRGVQRIDWDVEQQVVRAEPYFSHVVHDAVAAAGRGELLIDLVRDWEQFLVEGYDTFGECWGWGTPVHGWSSTPARDLITHVLGITPDLPGYARVRIAPRPGRLHEIAGAVPTPHGPVEVRISGAGARIDSPVPILLVAQDGAESELPAGQHEVDVR